MLSLFRQSPRMASENVSRNYTVHNPIKDLLSASASKIVEQASEEEKDQETQDFAGKNMLHRALKS